MRYTFAWFYMILVLIISCSQTDQQKSDWKPEDGYVPDEETARRVVEVLWVRIYGEKILENKPFKVFLRDSSIWVVEGTLKPGLIGGTPYAEIQKTDGKILKIYHTK